jgi:hypothetical protein
MKNLLYKFFLLSVFLLLTFGLWAQYISNSSAYSYKGVLGRESLQMPSGDGPPVTGVNAPDPTYSGFYYDRVAGTAWMYDVKTSAWVQISSTTIIIPPGNFLDSTGQPQNRLLFALPGNHIGSSPYYLVDTINKKMVINGTNVSLGGSSVNLAVNGNVLFNGTAKIGAYTLPNTDGTSGQVLTSNGAGNVSWANATSAETDPLSVHITDSAAMLAPYARKNEIPAATIPTLQQVTTVGNTTNLSILAKNYDATNNEVLTRLGGNRFLFVDSANANLSLGILALKSNTTGQYNVGFGRQALYANTTGGYNTAMGFQSLMNSTTQSNNVAIGYNAMSNISTSNAYNNTAVGSGALQNNQTYHNVATGYNALNANTTGSWNTAAGSQSLQANTSGVYNTALGYNSLANNTTGVYSTALGVGALGTNTTGGWNAAVGAASLGSNTTGNSNESMGYYALNNNKTGSNNVAIGGSALNSLEYQITGAHSYNTAIGDNAGFWVNDGSTNNTSIDHNVYVGDDTRSFSATAQNQNVFGSKAQGNGSNTTTISNSSVIGNYFGGGAIDINTFSSVPNSSTLQPGHAQLLFDGSILKAYKNVSGTITQTNFGTKRVVTYTTATTITLDPTVTDMITVTALASDVTFNTPVANGIEGQELIIRIKDNGTPHVITWNGVYRASPDYPILINTIANKTCYMKFVWNTADTKWDMIGLINNF